MITDRKCQLYYYFSGYRNLVGCFFFIDHNECTFDGSNLGGARVNCGFGDCVNVDGSYVCHCKGDVSSDGTCVGFTTTQSPEERLENVPEGADDGE